MKQAQVDKSRFKIRHARYGEEQQKAEFLEQALSLSYGDKVLDIGSGNGKLASILEFEGYNMFAIDRRSPEYELHNYVNLDFFTERIPFKDLDAAYILYPFLGDHWWKFDSFLQNIGQTLKQGGKFCVDLFYFNSVPKGYSREYIVDKGEYILTTFESRKSGAFVTHKTKKYPDGYVFEYDNLWRVFEQEELNELVSDNGFKMLHTFVDFSDNTIHNWDSLKERQRICVVIEKI